MFCNRVQWIDKWRAKVDSARLYECAAREFRSATAVLLTRSIVRRPELLDRRAYDAMLGLG
jgi:hypothetical protein